MKITKVILILVLGLFLFNIGYSQDPVFSQFYKNKEYLNPAYTGIGGGWSSVIQTRTQWNKVGESHPVLGTYDTQFVSTSFSTAEEKSSIGAYIYRDRAGSAVLSSLGVALNYCYVLPLRLNNIKHNDILRLGFGFRYNQKMIDWNALVFSDQLDAKEGLINPVSAHAANFEEFSNNFPWWTALNLGLVYRYLGRGTSANGMQFEIGLAATQLTSLLTGAYVESLQNLNSTGLSTRFTLNGQIFFPKLQVGAKNNLFTPFPAFRIDYQGGISAFALGADLYFSSIAFGVFYQNTLNPVQEVLGQSTDALILSCDLNLPFNKKHEIAIGFSYDINLNGLSTYTGNTFELALRYFIPPYGKRVLCPPTNAVHRRSNKNTWNRNPKNKNLN